MGKGNEQGLMALVRQAIFHVLDDGNHRTLGLEWDFTKDEERVDFADAVVAWIPQVKARLDAACDVSHTSGTPRTDEIAYRRIVDEDDENAQYDALLALARELERELATAISKLRHVRAQLLAVTHTSQAASGTPRDGVTGRRDGQE